MKNQISRFIIAGQRALIAIREEHGQDLVEYAAVISLVVLALVGGMSTLANGINMAMGAVSTYITSTIG
jgi:Flp pilus assembly pilin Flp